MMRWGFYQYGFRRAARQFYRLSAICTVVIAGVASDAYAVMAVAQSVMAAMAEHDIQPPRAFPLAASDVPAGSALQALDGEDVVAQPASHELEGAPTPLPPPGRLEGTALDIAQAQPNTLPSAGLPAGKPISLTFRDAELRSVLAAFAEFTGLNLIVSDKVRNTVSLRLVNVPWRRAFDALLDAHGLAMEQRGNVIWVAPSVEIAARERLRLETHAKGAQLEPLTSRVFALHYPHAEDVRKMLAGSGSQRLLSKRGGANVDARTNQLFVTDIASKLDEIGRLIELIDRPTRQVLIEARIVEAEEGLSQSLGTRLSLRAREAAMGAAARDAAARQSSNAANAGGEAIIDFSAHALSGFAPAALGLTLFTASASRLLDFELSALEAQGRGRIVSRPRVVTADRFKAIVEQGTELPYQVKAAQKTATVQFRRATLKLEVEPQITPRGYVMLDLDVAKDSIGSQTPSGPAINTKHVQTRVEVENGGTVAIGGIYSHDDRHDVARVPWLSRIPLLGALFRHQTHSDRRSELIVFITPTVVSGLPQGSREAVPEQGGG